VNSSFTIRGRSAPAASSAWEEKVAALWCCRLMACLRGSRIGEPARLQAVSSSSIAQVLPADSCLPMWDHLLEPLDMCDRPVLDDELSAMNVAEVTGPAGHVPR
jgi:hypothetical protein